eukprot:4983395-Prymnesium_polylepis.1
MQTQGGTVLRSTHVGELRSTLPERFDGTGSLDPLLSQIQNLAWNSLLACSTACDKPGGKPTSLDDLTLGASSSEG